MTATRTVWTARTSRAVARAVSTTASGAVLPTPSTVTWAASAHTKGSGVTGKGIV